MSINTEPGASSGYPGMGDGLLGPHRVHELLWGEPVRNDPDRPDPRDNEHLVDYGSAVVRGMISVHDLTPPDHIL